MWPFPAFAAAALALFVERRVGYPQAVYDSIGHPVAWLGKLIDLLDRHLNRPFAAPHEARIRGLIAVALLLAAAVIPSWLMATTLGQWRHGWIIEAGLATTLIAQRSMHEHVAAVLSGLNRSLDDGRRAVSQIVGRDPATLDEAGVARAALESLAENSSDGIVAPALWYGLLGLPGLAVYKAINTADSMIGHKSSRYLHFGWAAARLDDLVNLPASRLTGLLFAAAVPHRFSDIVEVMRRDAPKHQSPNAGWPESSLAAALGLRLGGPRSYGGEPVDLPWMGEGRALLTRADIGRGLALYGRAMSLLLAAMILLAIIA